MKVKVHFATNRNRVEGPAMFGQLFRDENDPSRYVTGSIDLVLNLPGSPDFAWEPDRNSLQLDPENEGVAPGPQGLESTAAGAPEPVGIIRFAAPQPEHQAGLEAVADRPFGIIHLHGFASSFENGLRRAAQVASEYGAKDIFSFSWPSNGVVTPADYFADQDDARRSSRAVARSLERLLAFTLRAEPNQRRPLHIVAHSMGVYTLKWALQHIRVRAEVLLDQRPFAGALLMAGDEQDDSLSRSDGLAPLLRLSSSVSVYTAGRDAALALSNVFNGKPRLGLFGPRNLVSLPGHVTRVDASDFSLTQGEDGNHFRHQYYRLAPAVINDVKQVIAGKPPNRIEPRHPHPDFPENGRGWLISQGAGGLEMAAGAAEVWAESADG